MLTTIQNLQFHFPNISFEVFEAFHDEDLCAWIDYFGKVGNRAFGIQIKHTTSDQDANNYKLSEWMQSHFQAFEEKYGGKVFIIFSSRTDDKKEIQNKEVIEEIRAEIAPVV